MLYFGDLCLDKITSYHLVEYQEQRMQEKEAKRKKFVAPSTISNNGCTSALFLKSPINRVKPLSGNYFRDFFKVL
jgi:hypothetical protein